MGPTRHAHHEAVPSHGRHRGRRRAGVAALVIGVLALVAAACTSPAPPSLEQLKRTEFGNRALAEADLIGLGQAQPVLEFTVEDTPPSIFVNYVVPDERAADFAAAVDLPPGFALTKVRILDSDPAPRYWLSLNVYRVSGITTGLRAEWSTYVDDGTGTPRFMIVRARAAEGSVDPIGPLAPPEPFQHTLDPGGVIRTDMQRTVPGPTGPVLTPDDLFHSTITLPEPAQRQFVTPTREWVAANDFIYWLNGVNDRTFHNATAHSAQLISVDLADVTLADDTEWVPFIDPVPGHVLVYLGPIQFMIGPWWNITEPDGRVAESTRTNLLALKRQMYGGLSTISALNVLSGAAEPIVQTTITDSEPSVRWHWRIPAGQLGAFSAAALPPGFSLAPVSLVDGEAPDHWLTLHVHRQSGAEAGLRAEWSTSVDDGTGVHELILETRADHRALDPVNRFTDPYPLTHAVSGSTLSTTIGDGPSAFASTVELPAPGTGATEVPARSWVATSDLRSWPNGVTDRMFSDSSTLAPKVAVDPAGVAVSDGGRWAAFTAGGPDRVWVDQGTTGRITNPWWSLAP